METVIEAAHEGLAISEDQIRQYQQDGAICLRGVIDAGWIERLRAATDRVLASNGGRNANKKGGTGNFTGDLDLWVKDDEFRAFAFQGPNWGIAKALMRASTIRLFSDQLFVKEPGTSTPSPWHHDQPYWPVTGDHVCSVWVTMDPVTKESSGLEYVRGSHRWGRRYDPVDFGETSMDMLRNAANEKIPDIEANRDSYDFLSWDMEPGDCLVHHSLAVHGAGGNRSQTLRRRAIATRWLGDEAYFKPNGSYTPERVGLEPGAPMVGPLFPSMPAEPGRDVIERKNFDRTSSFAQYLNRD